MITRTKLQRQVDEMIDKAQEIIDSKLEAKEITYYNAIKMRAAALDSIQDTLTSFEGSLLKQLREMK